MNPAPVAGLVLAGGAGRRMGGEIAKPLTPLGGRPLIAHVLDRLAGLDPTLISAPDPVAYAFTGAVVLADRRPGRVGPLAGIEAGLAWLGETATAPDRCVVVPGDTPFLPLDLVARLMAKSGDVPVVATHHGRVHPTVGVWPTACREALSAWLDDGDRPRAVRAFLDANGYVACAFDEADCGPHGDPFFNVNTPQDLAVARRHHARHTERPRTLD